MSAPDYTQRLTDRIFLLSRGCPQMCQASSAAFYMPRAGMEIRRPGAIQICEREAR